MLQIELRKLSDLKPHPDNPRKAVKGGIEKLAESIKGNPEYFNARPIVVSDRTGVLTIIDGERRSEAAAYLGMAEVPTIVMSGLTYEQELEILIKGNTHTGVWDEIKLATEKWNANKLQGWGVDEKIFAQAEKVNKQKATEMLSDLHYDTIYYEPEEKPSIKLSDCVDLSIFEKKVEAIEQSKLSKKSKEVLKLFAYRFIRIDFENVANYYAFNATEEEQKIMERLRLVLVDNSVNGFIEDELLKVSQIAIDGVLNKQS